MPVSVAISGKIASGKSTVARLIAEYWGLKVASIAGAIKTLAECARCGNDDYSHRLLESLCDSDAQFLQATIVYSELREKHAAELASGDKPRAFLQDLGAGLRDVSEDIWVNSVLLRSEACSEHGFVCDDLRYENEAYRMQQSDWLLVRCECDEAVRAERIAELYPTIETTRLNHPSETALDNYPYWNLTLDTTPPIPQITEQLEDLLGERLY